MRYLLFISFALIQTSIFCMQQQETYAKRNNSKKALLADFENKKNFFKGCPAVHRFLKAGVHYFRQKSHQAGHTNNYNFYTRLADEGFLTVPHEIQVQYNAIHQAPDSTPEQKKDIQRAFDLMFNTTTFFTSDEEKNSRYNHFCGYSSKTIFRIMCENPQFLDLYEQTRLDTAEAKQRFHLAFSEQKMEMIKFYGGLVPEIDSDKRVSLLDFFALNENNECFHDPELYNSTKKITVAFAIIDLYQNTFGLPKKEFEDKLSAITGLLELNTQKILDGEPEQNSPCSVQ